MAMMKRKRDEILQRAHSDQDASLARCSRQGKGAHKLKLAKKDRRARAPQREVGATTWTSSSQNDDHEEGGRGGRPVTWIGGGGQDPSALQRMGVPELRALFLQVFGQHTASNNSVWLRKKLAEPVASSGPSRSQKPRSRDVHANIWTRGELPAGLPGAKVVSDMMDLALTAGPPRLSPEGGAGKQRVKRRTALSPFTHPVPKMKAKARPGCIPQPPALVPPKLDVPTAGVQLPLCRYGKRCPIIYSMEHCQLFRHPAKEAPPLPPPPAILPEMLCQQDQARRCEVAEAAVSGVQSLWTDPPMRKPAHAAAEAMKTAVACKPRSIADGAPARDEASAGAGKTANQVKEAELFCVCQSPDDGRFMIGCDFCERWYHPACVGLSTEKVTQWTEDTVYTCNLCQSDKAQNAGTSLLKPAESRGFGSPGLLDKGGLSALSAVAATVHRTAHDTAPSEARTALIQPREHLPKKARSARILPESATTGGSDEITLTVAESLAMLAAHAAGLSPSPQMLEQRLQRASLLSGSAWPQRHASVVVDVQEMSSAPQPPICNKSFDERQPEFIEVARTIPPRTALSSLPPAVAIVLEIGEEEKDAPKPLRPEDVQLPPYTPATAPTPDLVLANGICASMEECADESTAKNSNNLVSGAQSGAHVAVKQEWFFPSQPTTPQPSLPGLSQGSCAPSESFGVPMDPTCSPPLKPFTAITATLGFPPASRAGSV